MVYTTVAGKSAHKKGMLGVKAFLKRIGISHGAVAARIMAITNVAMRESRIARAANCSLFFSPTTAPYKAIARACGISIKRFETVIACESNPTSSGGRNCLSNMTPTVALVSRAILARYTAMVKDIALMRKETSNFAPRTPVSLNESIVVSIALRVWAAK